jgi:prophage antirepressor-like protein
MDLVNEKMIFNKDEVRIVGTLSDPWFVVKDICKILDIKDNRSCLRIIPEEWKVDKKISTSGGEQKMNTINEYGLYKLIMRSDKPIAQKFQEWICGEVLPSIRRKGEYKLEEYKQKIEEQNNRIKKLQRETQVVEGKNVVYLATSEESEKDGIYTVGKAINLKNRLQAYNDNKLHNFKIVKYISCKSIQLMDAIEKIILAKFNKYKIISKRDVFQLPKEKDVSFFTKSYDYFSNYFEDIEDNIELEEPSEQEQELLNDEIKEEKKEPKSEYNKKYREEHHDEILDREKDFREKNKEHIKEINKDYRLNNPEKEKARKEKYANEHKEEQKEYMEKYRKEKAVEIAESRKRYNLEHKEENEKRVQCSCGSIVSRQNINSHLDTDIHKEFLETGKNIQEQRKEESVECKCGLIISKRGLKRHEKSKLHQKFEKDGIKIKS